MKPSPIIIVQSVRNKYEEDDSGGNEYPIYPFAYHVFASDALGVPNNFDCSLITSAPFGELNNQFSHVASSTWFWRLTRFYQVVNQSKACL
jgi:hypothetical protein